MVLIRYIQCIHIRLYCDIPVPFQLETICDEGLSVVLTSFRYLKFLNRHRYPSKKNQLYLISLTFFLFRFLHSSPEIFHVPIIIVTTFIILYQIIANCCDTKQSYIYIYIRSSISIETFRFVPLFILTVNQQSIFSFFFSPPSFHKLLESIYIYIGSDTIVT